MAGRSRTRARTGVRVAGLLLVPLAAALMGAGAWLVHLALNWTMPAWLPPDLVVVPQGGPLVLANLADGPLGLAAGYVSLFGLVAGLNALWMLLTGRRNALLVALLLLMFTVFLAVGLYAALDDQPWSRLG